MNPYQTLVTKLFTGQITSQEALEEAFRLKGDEGVSSFIITLREDPRFDSELPPSIT